MVVTTKKVYQTMKEFHNHNGYPPSVRELAKILEASPGSVHNHISRLKKNGWLTNEPGKARTLKFLK